MYSKIVKKIGGLLGIWLMAASSANACTGLQLRSEDGAFINGRTLEFGIPITVHVLFIPQGYQFQGTAPDGSKGLEYHAKYAALGGATVAENAILDGMNEKGLSVAVFYFPGFAQYAEDTEDNRHKALSPSEFSNWILTQFATVDEVKKGVDEVAVTATPVKGWDKVPPFHYVVYDKEGKSIVIEPLKGELKVFDNPLGVVTNSPNFDWHLTNMSNYVNLSPMGVSNLTFGQVQFGPLGEGSGFLGLPGDFTPPSRFVRAAFFSQNTLPMPDADQTVSQMFHILNNFDIPYGAVRSMHKGKPYVEYTLFTSAKNPQDLEYYYRTYNDPQIYKVSFREFDPRAAHLQTLAVDNSRPGHAHNPTAALVEASPSS